MARHAPPATAIMLIALATALATATGARADDRPVLSFPLACTIGSDCIVQSHVDVDPGTGVSDYRCDRLAKDGHTGVDIRLPDLAAMRAGVPVLAAADGRVFDVRDGDPDQRYTRGDDTGTVLDAVLGVGGCGNGIFIEHGAGWQTTYCHLRRGSITVRPGDRVSAGQAIGLAGLSGRTDHPHLHFGVRLRQKTVEPFSGGTALDGCGLAPRPLWDAAANAAFARQTSPVIWGAGFATGALDRDSLDEPDRLLTAAVTATPAIVFGLRVVDVRAGDVIAITLTGPDGAIIAQHRTTPAERHLAETVAFAGSHRPAAGWTPGVLTGTADVIRDGAVAATTRQSITVTP